MVYPTKIQLQAAIASLSTKIESLPDEPVYHADAIYLFDRLNTQPTPGEKLAISNFMQSCDDDGIWTKLHGYYVLGAQLPELALRNLRPLPAYDATIEGSGLVHTPKVGYTGSGSGRLRTTYTVAPGNQNNNHLGILSLTPAGVAGGHAMGNRTSSMWPRNTTNQAYQRASSGTSVVVSPVTDGSGHLILSRTNGANYADIRAGALRATRPGASSAPSSGGFAILGNVELDGRWAAGAFAAHMGLGLTLEEAATLTTHTATLRSALAAL